MTSVLRNLLPIVMFSIVPTAAGAQEAGGTLKGVLVDSETDRPLRGAVVRLMGTEIEARTDIRGAFTIEAPAGSYAGLSIDRPGGGGVSLIEAEIPFRAGQVDDLAEIAVPSAAPPEGAPPAAPPPPPDTGMRPWLGVLVQDVSDGGDPASGTPAGVAVEVTKVFPGSPASAVGFQAGDRVVEMNGTPVRTSKQFHELVEATAPGGPAAFDLFRGGAEIEVTPVLPAVPTSLIDALSGAANPNPAALIPPPPSVLPPPPAPPSPGIGNEADSPGLVQEARRSIEAGRFQAAEEAYASYLRANPGDAAIAAERAELHFRHIDPEGGVLLMLQALRMEGLTVPDRTRLRLPIAQRRMETGDYGSAKEILLDAAREDPTDQDVRLFLDEVARFESGPPPPGGPVHPLVAEARSLAAQGRNAEADRAYEEYLKQNPQDGPVLAERAEFVYFNIQQARGMQLMVQAARLPGLPIHERTRLRLIVAQRRLEHGNLITARQMLIEASRDDPGNPAIGKLLFQIEEIERRIREEAAHRGPPPPGVHPDPRAELLRGLIEAIAEEIEED